MDADRPVPRLVVACSMDRLDELEAAFGPLREAGIEGVLVEGLGSVGESSDPSLRRLRAEAGLVRVMLAGSPRLAASVGADVLLPEGGMAAAEARRQLAPGALLGREVASASTAALATAVDLLVAPWTEDSIDSGEFRAAIESASCPVIWRVQHPDQAGQVLMDGGEGVIVPGREAAAAVDAVRIAATGLPSRDEQRSGVTVDGREAPLLPDSAVADLLADLGLRPERVTVNGVSVPRRTWDDRLLRPGDVVETVG